ncbi:Ig-like domain-containing protein, partial [Mesorhizobium sp. M7A.F.Ca.US.014.04.1.1]|uniref:Ig-like domain-containing protein n=2 Tax=Phyllobacteriaceae TaxID=69277 RepID=UPI0013DFD08D
PQVVAISPTEGAIPANTLRLYVTFDRPARGMVATRDLRLVDAEGRTVDGAFMDFGQDLWSPDGRRLTVLFDPGRVKQDVEGDGDSAAPLRPGLSYTVEVGRKHFHYRVTPALRTPVNPQTWGLALPNAGSREALKITFDREMDAALLRDQLGIVDDQGGFQSGRVTVSASGRAWCWRPNHGWLPGAYRLVVGSSLEDVSGNRVGEALDHDVGKPDALSQGSVLLFKVGPRVVRQDAGAC